MILLDGNKISKERLKILKEKVAATFAESKQRPGLVVVRVGDDPASQVYVSKKIKACQDVGFFSEEKHLSETASEDQLLKIIADLNANSHIHGILVQLPLPKQISEKKILECVLPEKDVDGFHPINLGRLLARDEGFVACTPRGIMTLLAAYKIPVAGKNAVVIGRSRIVGRPMSLLLDHAGATVTVVHSQTPNIEEFTTKADVLVVAIGKPKFISAKSVKKGAVVIDVGINRGKDGKLCGDVDFDSVSQIASAITPVPGGVGPMTIASLLENTWDAFENFSINSRKK